MSESLPAAIAWFGFAGAWLLVAGPMFQAAVELGEEDFNRDPLSSAGASVPQPAPVSPWWWLLPPIGYVLNRRRSQAYRNAVFASLTAEQRERFVSFTNKATGWLFVAGGAFFIALKETWELGELYEWPIGVYLGLVVVMLLGCAFNTVLRTRRANELVKDPTTATTRSRQG